MHFQESWRKLELRRTRKAREGSMKQIDKDAPKLPPEGKPGAGAAFGPLSGQLVGSPIGKDAPYLSEPDHVDAWLKQQGELTDRVPSILTPIYPAQAKPDSDLMTGGAHIDSGSVLIGAFLAP